MSDPLFVCGSLSHSPERSNTNPAENLVSDDLHAVPLDRGWNAGCGQTQAAANLDAAAETRAASPGSALAFQLDTARVGADPKGLVQVQDDSDGIDEEVLAELNHLLADVRSAVEMDGPLIQRLERVAEQRRQWDGHLQTLEERLDRLQRRSVVSDETQLELERARTTIRDQEQRLLDQQADLDAKSEILLRLEAKSADWQQRAVDLQSRIESTKDELEQLRSQRNVARSEVEKLQRHWQQQNIEYERRLNNARVDCEQLRRELAIRKSGERGSPEVEPTVHAAIQPKSASDPSDEAIAVSNSEPSDLNLRHVFTRIRDHLQNSG